MTPQNLPIDAPKEWWELYFVWATIWAVAGVLSHDPMIDSRAEFSKWFVHEFKTVRFPPHGTVFDCSIDSKSKRFEPWSTSMEDVIFDPDLPVQVVHRTVTRIRRSNKRVSFSLN
jgi:dynein heavy chain, axonemal